jgi:glucose-1-phosphate thymidylyltransferase
MPVKAVVLAQSPEAGGRTGVDRTRPSELLPVANRPILFHGLETMAAAGIQDVAIMVTPQTEGPIREAVGRGASWGLDVSYLAAKRTRGLAGLLLEAEDFLDGQPFILQQGSGLLQDDLGPLVSGLQDDAPDALLLVHRCQAGSSARPARLRDRALLSLAGGLAPGPGMAVAGVQLFGREFMPRARARLSEHRDDQHVGALTDDLRRAGARVEVRLVAGWRRYEGDLSDLLELNRMLLDRLPGDAGDVGPRTQIEGRVSIHPSAHVEGTTIRGPAIIGAEARIVDSFIGPYTAIGECAQVEGSEIEHSIVLSGAECRRAWCAGGEGLLRAAWPAAPRRRRRASDPAMKETLMPIRRSVT